MECNKNLYKIVIERFMKNASDREGSPLGRLGWAGVLGGGATYGAGKGLGFAAEHMLPDLIERAFSFPAGARRDAVINSIKNYEFAESLSPKMIKLSKYMAGAGAAALGLKYLINEIKRRNNNNDVLR